jgi:hypothetical protein
MNEITNNLESVRAASAVRGMSGARTLKQRQNQQYTQTAPQQEQYIPPQNQRPQYVRQEHPQEYDTDPQYPTPPRGYLLPKIPSLTYMGDHIWINAETNEFYTIIPIESKFRKLLGYKYFKIHF